MAMVIALIFKTLDDVDDDKEAKLTAASPKDDEMMEGSNDGIIRLGRYSYVIIQFISNTEG